MSEEEKSDSGMMTSVGSTQLESSLAKYILNAEEMLQIIYIRLNGMVWEEDEYVRKEEKALMTQEGVDLMIGTLMNAINHRGVFMSNFADWETAAVIEEMLDDVATILFVLHKEFKIKSLSDRTIIMVTIRTNLLATLKRPYDEGERKLLKKVTIERHSYGDDKGRRIGLGLGRLGGR